MTTSLIWVGDKKDIGIRLSASIIIVVAIIHLDMILIFMSVMHQQLGAVALAIVLIHG